MKLMFFFLKKTQINILISFINLNFQFFFFSSYPNKLIINFINLYFFLTICQFLKYLFYYFQNLLVTFFLPNYQIKQINNQIIVINLLNNLNIYFQICILYQISNKKIVFEQINQLIFFHLKFCFKIYNLLFISLIKLFMMLIQNYFWLKWKCLFAYQLIC
ncbi:transmembrane protein, putative (macronuclear) [Tetrahymena thermophila SB210]|uniref:Transmembrane protein, putative n=1 Tax=Tetrahymena thermophila (strain SB210) TaxID=312017 RepID=W7XFP9_TETTS|nr:transmembrane protein, putative [Tetrahymena thermophila SB210]EWS76697.1 transmembrane protein, putative [Tetrahymena thermophila SB210]|eukprot:XP_012650767.1 transmembrane protein, putative [Tetrahymena thermophila SB210]